MPVPVPEPVVGDVVGDGVNRVVKVFGYVAVNVAVMESGPVVWADFISL